MTIFGKKLSEYLSFQKLFLALVLIIGLLRLSLSLAGISEETVKWFSLTAVITAGFLYYSIRVYTSGFGTYKHLLPLLVIQNLLSNAITIIGIAIGIFTETDNIFTKPEFSGFYEGRSWLHALGHLLGGVIILSLMQWAVGSLIMFITSKVAPANKRVSAT